MPRFVIDLGDVELSSDASQRLGNELQKVALSHISGMGSLDALAIRFPREWVGLIARKDFESLKAVDKEIHAGIGKVQGGLRR